MATSDMAVKAEISLQVIQGCKYQVVIKKTLQKSLELAVIIKFAQGLEIWGPVKFVKNSVQLCSSIANKAINAAAAVSRAFSNKVATAQAH